MTDPKKILAVIPARGGSKKVIGKNMRDFCGKPLICHTIDEASKSKYINRIITTTDSPEIRKIALDAGSEAPFLRPDELAGDLATDYPVFVHCIEWLKENEDYVPDIVIHLRPTAPLRRTHHMDDALEIFMESDDADALRSVCPIGDHPNKAWKIEDDHLVPFIPESVSGIKESYNQPRQQLPVGYIQNGNIDIFRPNTLIDKKSMTGDRIKAYVMDKFDSVNIDDEIDFEFAEFVYRRKYQDGPTA